MTVTISRLYDDYASAERAVCDLEAAGVPHSDISIVSSNADKRSPDSITRKSRLKSSSLDGACLSGSGRPSARPARSQAGPARKRSSAIKEYEVRPCERFSVQREARHRDSILGI
jgi:hypothetical protein